ncbi:MAG: PQQ-binding-like beta-propeller repeat protein, partial [Eubacteriales bacterium]|nr:PQQ-binding-like beta-propeller repeat protein [Eubacteriales bacterium]
MKKRVLCLLLTLMMAMSMIPTVALGTEVSAQWKNFRNSDVNMAITDAYTPKSVESTELKWANQLGTSWQAAPSVQIIVDDCLVVMCGKVLYKLSLETGEILQQADMAAAPSYGYTPPTYAEGMIFCPLANGIVQAFDAKTLASLWVYQDELKGQAQSPITYADGCIYTGFWNGEAKDANYVCLTVKDEDVAQADEIKTAVWTKTVTGGFYWAGSVVLGDAVIVGTDDGASGSKGTSHVYSLNKTTGEEISSLELTGAGDQRSSMAYSADMGRVFFTTKGGYLCSAAVSGAGVLSELKMVNYNAQSTSTPVVYDGKVYFATGSGITSSGSKGNFVVADADTLEMCYYVGLLGYPQCSVLLSTAYYGSEGKLYFYSTYNNNPGGLSLIKVDPTKDTADEALELVEIYDAAGYEQYCITSPICDDEGTIYYKNDSGNVLAVSTAACTEHTGGCATCAQQAV